MRERKRAYRGAGMARERSDGRWEVRVTVQGQRMSAYGSTLEEAKAKAEALKARGAPRRRGGVTVGDWLDEWLESARLVLKAQTWIGYRGHIRDHITPALGHVRLDALTPAHLDTLHARCAHLVSGTTAHHIHTTLSSALTAAERRGLIRVYVARLVSPPRRTGAEIVVLDAAAADRLIEAAKGHPLDALWRLAVRLGPRQGELLALRWKHVDLDRRRLEIVASSGRSIDGEIVLNLPKTAAGRRTLEPLPESIVDALRRTPRTSEFVWPGPGGQQFHPSTFSYGVWRRFRQEAGLPPVRFHALRHTAATRLLDEGVQPHVVATLLGHASVTTLLRIYAHVTRVGLDQAMSVIAALDDAPALRVLPESATV